MNRGKKDELALITLRAVPIVPTAIVSIVCGLISYNLRAFVVATFIGLVPRNLFYLYLGYYSTDTLMALNSNVDGVESFGNVVIALVLLAIFGYIVYRKFKRKY